MVTPSARLKAAAGDHGDPRCGNKEGAEWTMHHGRLLSRRGGGLGEQWYEWMHVS